MKLKALTMTALLGVFLAGSNAYAWGNHSHHSHGYHKPHKVKVYKKVYKVVKKPVYVKPKTYHQHPANGLTNDLFHSHPNGNNYHTHHYGTGHTYGYICPVPQH